MEPRIPRRERERLRHRQEILDAARKIVADRGLDGLTVDLVAREAEFAVGSIYRHFRSKEELIEVLISEFAEPIFDELEALPASGAPFAEQLAALVRVAYESRVEAAPLFKAFLIAPGDLPSLDGKDGDRMRRIMERYFAAVAAVLAVGQAEGALAAGDLTPMTVALAGLLDSFTKWVVLGPTPIEGDVPALICRTFLHGFGADA